MPPEEGLPESDQLFSLAAISDCSWLSGGNIQEQRQNRIWCWLRAEEAKTLKASPNSKAPRTGWFRDRANLVVNHSCPLSLEAVEAFRSSCFLPDLGKDEH